MLHYQSSLLQDSFRHKGMRRALVRQIAGKGIRDEAVLGAIENVPRHLFLEAVFLEQAYEDKAFPIGEGQTISQPYTVAYQTQALGVQKGHKVLEVGTGSGYQAAVLAELGAKVFSIEFNNLLFHRTKNLLTQLRYPIHVFYGDGSRGLPGYAPYDRILVTAGAPAVPSALTEQLAPGGVLVIPVGSAKSQEMLRITRLPDGKLREEKLDRFSFVPLLGQDGWK
ncbi:MAG TPA: protein-L-isoaspartate(D-aspartate) O-methyltransferase [Cytophagales bacterium]